ncbi:MAG TPA: 2,3-bisphosphoglycerate-independent phosphoglycerate mutase [Gemmatimonadaceae bacterium]|nr:2,3-bisphosphoglycerate-independent phosphoglycerate mutase [Gemmatimonadaceae bacterium]
MATQGAKKQPVVLIVLDGWGYRAERDGNAIALSRTPTWDALWNGHPRTLLEASGLAVGLPRGQMGNSEVGHLNLGAGRVVPQDIVRIDAAIQSGDFFHNDVFAELCRETKKRSATLHLVGLIGSGGVHAVDRHLFALIDLASELEMPHVAIHALLDGRDTMPRSALRYMQETLTHASRKAVVASLGGRYYGMDRDKRWDRTELWYDAMALGQGPQAEDPVAAIRAAYDRGESDEFVKPIVIAKQGQPVAPMRDGDGVIFFNYRADRMRQLVRAVTSPAFDAFDIDKRPNVNAVSMTQYDETFTIPVAFPPLVMSQIVAEVLAEHGRTQFRTAETEKYAHVTYFFNGGFESPYRGEIRELVPSQKVATYDLAPEMSAKPLTEVLCRAIQSRDHDFILCNYANGDMVGHTGVIPAVIKAVETVDECLGRVLSVAGEAGARVVVTADHGNCEMMIDPETGGPHTAHTTNPVPFIVIDPDGERALRSGGALGDVGPTLLTMMGIEQPAEMTGRDLRQVHSHSPRAGVHP